MPTNPDAGTGRAVLAALLAPLVAACAGSGGNSNSQNPQPPPVTPPVITEKMGGLNFSPYLDGQSPNLGTQISENQLTTRMELLVPLTRSVRTYSVTHGLQNAGRVAHNLGLSITVGAFLSRDSAQNEQQKSNLLAAVRTGATDSTVILGSEVLERGDLPEAALIADLEEFRQQLPSSIRLGYADTIHQLLDHPRVVDHADVVFANVYPYFDGVPLDQALRHVDFLVARLQAAVAPKPVVISETGWPGNGPVRGGAIPSAANAAAFLENFTAWARARHIEYFYFEAFDEAWKTDEGAQGPHWGILDTSGNMKPGMSAAFDGSVGVDNWDRPIPGAGSAAELHLISLPALNSFDDLRGQLTGVDPALFRIAVYIRVNNLWYPKPSFQSPTTYPDINGNWSVDITTGPQDESATGIAAYLLPVSFRIPQVNAGSAAIPGEIVAAAITKAEASR